MTDTVAQPGTVALEPPSTVLNPHTVHDSAGNGTPSLSEGNESKSIQDVLESELADIKARDAEEQKATKDKAEDAARSAKDKVDDAEKAEKAKASDKDKEPEPKSERPRAQDGKFARAEKADVEDTAKAEAKAEQGAPEKAAAGQEGSERRQSEGRQHSEPPARFLPEARTKWANVPNEVKAEFHRVSQEYEGEIEKHRQASERYESVRQFDEIARQNGRELKDSLTKVVQIEQALARNPVIGLEMILREIGPRKADGSPISLYEVAQHISKLSPEQFAQNMRGAVPQAQPQAQQVPPVVSQLAQQVQELRLELAQTKLNPVLERFAAEHPDYETLAPQIAKILQAKVIDQLYGPGLSPEQKLEQAYRMAGGQVPSSRSTPEPAPQHSEPPPARPVNPDAGTKSVRGAPSDGADTTVDEEPTELRDLLRKELRKIA